MRKLILLFAIVFAMVFSFGCSSGSEAPAETEPITVIIEETTLPEETATQEEEVIEETTEPPVEETTKPSSSSSSNKKPSTTKPSTTKPTAPKDETPTTTVPPETTVPETTVPEELAPTEPETTAPAEPEEPKEESNLVYLGNFRLTAYCNCSKCCGKWAGGPTATGTMPKQGRTIAVDPKVIPYGSKVVINGHTYIAEDCGSGIKNKKIDIYFDSHSAANKFGVQYADVYLKK